MVAYPSTMTTDRAPSLLEATTKATTVWQQDLKTIFDKAKDLFPDVVWELLDENDNAAKAIEEVWGHKGERSCFVCAQSRVPLALRPSGRVVYGPSMTAALQFMARGMRRLLYIIVNALELGLVRTPRSLQPTVHPGS